MTGYLKDPTGSRRFWPVTCHGMIDRDGLARDRDQLWAEAVHLFKNGTPWWLETPELEALATAEQAARFVVDAWKAPIEKWLGKRRVNRVSAILTTLEFTRVRARKGGGRETRYRREN